MRAGPDPGDFLFASGFFFLQTEAALRAESGSRRAGGGPTFPGPSRRGNGGWEGASPPSHPARDAGNALRDGGTAPDSLPRSLGPAEPVGQPRAHAASSSRCLLLLRGCPGFRESSEPLSGRSWRLKPRSFGSSPAGPRAGVCSALGRSLPREPSGGSAARRERGTDTLRELRGELPSGLEPPGAGLAPGAPVSGARHPPNPPHIRGEAAISRAAFPISGAPARERCCGGRAGAGEN